MALMRCLWMALIVFLQFAWAYDSCETYQSYPWPSYDSSLTSSRVRLDDDLEVPEGFTRKKVKPNSYGDFVECLPLKSKNSPFLYYTGKPTHQKGKRVYSNLSHQKFKNVRILNIPIWNKNMQCTEFAILNRATYSHWYNQTQVDDSTNEEKLSFYTRHGFDLSFDRYKNEGVYFKMNRLKELETTQLVDKNNNHPTQNVFEHYLNHVYSYVNSAGLIHSLIEIHDTSDVQAGDMFIYVNPNPKRLGHVYVVLSVARNESGRLKLLIGQGNTPSRHFNIHADQTMQYWKNFDGQFHHGKFSLPWDQRLYRLYRFSLPKREHQMITRDYFLKKVATRFKPIPKIDTVKIEKVFSSQNKPSP